MKLGRYSKVSILVCAITGVVIVLLGIAFLRFELTIRAEGIVLPEQDHVLFASNDGVVHRLHVRPGQSVTKGELLIELDQPDLHERLIGLEQERQRNNAERTRLDWTLKAAHIRVGDVADVTAPRRLPLLARIEAIQSELTAMYSEMQSQEIVSQLDVHLREIEQLRANIEWIQASVEADWWTAGWPDIERARIADEIKEAEQQKRLLDEEQALLTQQLEQGLVHAPIDGDVLQLFVRFEGAAVQRGDQLVRLASPDGPRLVRVYAPPRNIDLVQSGTAALIQSAVFDSFLEGYAHGTVRNISPHPVQDIDSARRYEVDIQVHDSPYPLVYDSPVEVRLLLGRRALSDILLRSAGSSRQRRPLTPLP